MNFRRAVKEMRKGNSVRRKHWRAFLFCKAIDGEIVINTFFVQGLTLYDVEANDWEIYE